MKTHNDENQPRLKLETDGSGPGKRIRTALGMADSGGNYIDPSTLPDPPWWFRFHEPWLRWQLHYQFTTLPLNFALSLLERAKVPPIYRLALGFHWGFMDAEREQFTRGDLAEIMDALELLHGSLEAELERIERRAAYQIWHSMGSDWMMHIYEYWRNHDGLYS